MELSLSGHIFSAHAHFCDSEMIHYDSIFKYEQQNNSELFFIFSCHLLPIDRVNIFRTQNLIQWDVLPHSVDESSPIVLAVADIWPDPIE